MSTFILNELVCRVWSAPAVVRAVGEHVCINEIEFGSNVSGEGKKKAKDKQRIIIIVIYAEYKLYAGRTVRIYDVRAAERRAPERARTAAALSMSEPAEQSN